MMRVALAALFLLGGFLTAHAQQPDAVLPDLNRSTIYLTFERFGGRDSVWLRLHNNTRWAISFRTKSRYNGTSVTPLGLSDGRQVSGLVDGLEVVPEYFIEHATDRVTSNGQHWCTAATSWLPAGRSVVFNFPRQDLKPWEQIYVKFMYEWELGDNDPEHRVMFHGFDLGRFE